MKNISAALITTFRPDKNFPSRLMPVSRYCNFVIIIDNTPGCHIFIDLPENVIVFQDGNNKGLGCALNLGMKRVRELGVNIVFLFDQDSTPTEDILDGLCQGLNRYGAEKNIVGPTHLDDQKKTKVENVIRKRSNFTCLPTSGLTLNPQKLTQDEIFSEILFLDFVDFEWCWRLRTNGWKIYKLPDVVMLHRLGLAEGNLMGLKYHIPAPYRHYFQFRDTLHLLPLGYVPLQSKVRLSILLPIKLLIYPFILDKGGERFKWMIRGIIDALRSVTGVGAAAKKLK